MHQAERRTWDLFCRLVDNFGDVGVCWRLAADLASRGQRVRLWIDDASPLRFIAPDGAPGVELHAWPAEDDRLGGLMPGDVVIESFGCNLPAGFVDNMLLRPRPPVWINLEYLGVEGFAARSHGLPSPQRNGLPKWFFFPGFAPGTGGLLREPGLMQARASFDRDRWLASHGIKRQPHERVVLLFCYANPAVAGLLRSLAQAPTLLLLTPGPAQQQVQSLFPSFSNSALRTHALPWLSQAEFDCALWSADLNCIRGEDSLVRALWAGAATLWQLYPEDADARDIKLRAWLQHFFPQNPPTTRPGDEPSNPLYRQWLQTHRRYNSLDQASAEAALVLPELQAWTDQVRLLREQVLLQGDLCSQLQAFVASKS